MRMQKFCWLQSLAIYCTKFQYSFYSIHSDNSNQKHAGPLDKELSVEKLDEMENISDSDDDGEYIIEEEDMSQSDDSGDDSGEDGDDEEQYAVPRYNIVYRLGCDQLIFISTKTYKDLYQI